MRHINLLLILGLLMPALALAAPRELRDSEGRLTTLVFAPNDEATTALTAGSPEATAAAFLTSYAVRLGLQDPSAQLKPLSIEVDELGQTHLHWQQVWQGVPVRTGELALHLNHTGRPTLATAKIVPNITGSSKPGLGEGDAVILADHEWLQEYGPVDVPDFREPELVWVDAHAVPGLPGPRLVWQVSSVTTTNRLTTDVWLVDAQNGVLLARQSTERLLDRRVYNCSNSGSWSCPSEQYSAVYNYWFGRREVAPMRGPNPQTPYGSGYAGSQDTDGLHTLFGQVHNYWLINFALDGANGLGGTGDGTLYPFSRTGGHILLDHLWNSCPDNAGYFGDMGRMYFCAGTTIPDIVGHEYFHAVVWFAFSPQGTEYTGQVGALEEGSCDVFGQALQELTEGESNWRADLSEGRFIRDFANPASLGNPDRFMSPQFYCGGADNGGIHHNSTIPSHAAYLMAEGGLHNGCEIPAIGFEAVQRIWYRAWCQYFTRTTTFNESVIAFQTACQDLYGVSHPEYLASVTAALQAVEMDQPGYCSGIPEAAPACAVVGGGAAWTGLANGDADSLFTDSESVWLHSHTGVPGRRVLVHRLVPDSEPGLWEEIPSGADTLSVTVGGAGVLAANLGSLPEGDWTLLLDGDHDGFWQPWADQQLHVSISATPPQVTGLTARVQGSAGQADRIQLTWSRLPGALPSTLYQVEGDTLPQFTLPQLLVATPDTTWTDSLSVSSMPLRVYRVKAITP